MSALQQHLGQQHHPNLCMLHFESGIRAIQVGSSTKNTSRLIGHFCQCKYVCLRVCIVIFLLKPIKKQIHLVLCEQRNGKSAVARSLSPSERQAACCTSGTAIREQDERDNDADVARVFENVEHPAQVLVCGKIGSDHFVLPLRLDTVFELAQQQLFFACRLCARQICLAPRTASPCCSSDLS